ncbi:hypothetical protein RND81_08G053600 [Saponaria officinalis]|uniref:Ribosomal protein S3 n=1 Tax=Saponaria officinalis TaxID=3572 RepID=A0AAW1J4P5_SAPOF
MTQIYKHFSYPISTSIKLDTEKIYLLLYFTESNHWFINFKLKSLQRRLNLKTRFLSFGIKFKSFIDGTRFKPWHIEDLNINFKTTVSGYVTSIRLTGAVSRVDTIHRPIRRGIRIPDAVFGYDTQTDTWVDGIRGPNRSFRRTLGGGKKQ